MSDDETLPPPSGRLRLFIIGGVSVVMVAVLALYFLALARANHEAPAQTPKPVTIARAEAGSFRPQRVYIGTIEAWNSARVGPQFLSAYVATVLFRPGATVRRGEVL